VNLAVKLGLVPEELGDTFRTGPWPARRVVAVAAANAVAVALAVLAWSVTSQTGSSTTQVRWSTVGLLGVVIALASNTWFLARGRQMIRVGHGMVFGERRVVPFRTDDLAPVTNGRSTVARRIPGGDRYLTVPGTSRYHRPSCPLVAQKDIDEAPRSVHEKAGRRACEVCEP
jgi:hypothetical protein